MFAPINPMTERVRIENERRLLESQAVASALPEIKPFAALSKVLKVRRPAAKRQPHPVTGPQLAEHA